MFPREIIKNILNLLVVRLLDQFLTLNFDPFKKKDGDRNLTFN